MEDNIVENEVVEVIESPNTNEVESNEPEVVVEDKPEKFEPWKIKPESKTPESIPYERFKEINDERKAYQSKLEEYESKIASIESEKEKLDKIKGPEDINIADYDDVDAYMKDVIAATKRAAVADVERNYQEREMRRVEEAKNTEIVTRFQSNIEEASKYNPDILEAVNFLDQYAGSINPRIARELLLDENAGEVIHDIVTDQALLNKLFKGDVDEFIRTIHKMSAMMDKETRRSGGVVSAKVESVPSALPKKTITGIPVTAKSTSKSPTKDPAKMNEKEFAAWRENGGI
jgi:hypothetical protein